MSALEWLLNSLKRLPVIETCLFMVLAVITVYRKKLSSNDEYRGQPKKKPLKNRVASTKTGNSHLETSTSLSGRGLGSFSDELCFAIALYLLPEEIAQLSQCNQHLYYKLQHEQFWREKWMLTFGPIMREPFILDLCRDRGISFELIQPPTGSWRQFFVVFECTWLNWLLAGCNCFDRCCIALDGDILDVTIFQHDHPGSPETLAAHSGCDCSELYREIGHSTFADEMRTRFVAVTVPEHAKPRDNRLYRTLHKILKLLSRSALDEGLREGLRQQLLSIQPQPGLSSAASATIGHHRHQQQHTSGSESKLVERLTYWASDFCESHPGQHREGLPLPFFDPLTWRMGIWYTCCGRTRSWSLDELPDEVKSQMHPVLNSCWLRQTAKS